MAPIDGTSIASSSMNSSMSVKYFRTSAGASSFSRCSGPMDLAMHSRTRAASFASIAFATPSFRKRKPSDGSPFGSRAFSRSSLRFSSSSSTCPRLKYSSSSVSSRAATFSLLSGAGAAGAARAADAVRVALDVLRHVVVDDVLDALDVDAASRDVGRHQNLKLARLEALDRELARRLVLARVDNGGRVAHLVERAREHVAAALAVAKDDDGRRRPVLQQLEQLVLLLVLLEHLDVLRDVGLGGALVADVHKGGLPQVVLRDPLHRRRHRRREHVGLPVLSVARQVDERRLVVGLEVGGGHCREHGVHLRLEAHVDHPVRLVEHHVVALVEHEVPPVERVVQPARRRDHHLHALVGDEALLLDGHAADDGVDADLELAAKLARLVLDLLDQLARRRHDEREWAVGRRLARDWRLAEDVDEHRQHEGARLAGAGLCDADHVLDGEPERDSHHLDGGRLLVPRLSDGREDLRR
mmetsp:Transcript_44612/g.143900  ORF Transcript_44612/g.143900 Transcript_44612/m.143900 type:complete len:471 (-) Transcript_44612:94-1506(-)